MRNAAASRWWTRWIARYLLRREARALAMLEGVKGIPALVCHDRDMLVRSFLEGEPLYVARPDDGEWFKAAARLLRRLHRAGVTHNDLAKEPNLLVRRDGAVTQYVALDRRAWHAGESFFRGRTRCNDFAIGVDGAPAGATSTAAE